MSNLSDADVRKWLPEGAKPVWDTIRRGEPIPQAIAIFENERRLFESLAQARKALAESRAECERLRPFVQSLADMVITEGCSSDLASALLAGVSWTLEYDGVEFGHWLVSAAKAALARRERMDVETH